MRPNAQATARVAPAPGPLTLLPAARSPGRPCCHGPPVGSYPTLSALTRDLAATSAGMLAVAVVVTSRLPAKCPHLLFHGAASPVPSRAGWESGSSSLKTRFGAAAHRQIMLILLREGIGVKRSRGDLSRNRRCPEARQGPPGLLCLAGFGSPRRGGTCS